MQDVVMAAAASERSQDRLVVDTTLTTESNSLNGQPLFCTTPKIFSSTTTSPCSSTTAIITTESRTSMVTTNHGAFPVSSSKSQSRIQCGSQGGERPLDERSSAVNHSDENDDDDCSSASSASSSADSCEAEGQEDFLPSTVITSSHSSSRTRINTLAKTSLSNEVMTNSDQVFAINADNLSPLEQDHNAITYLKTVIPKSDEKDGLTTSALSTPSCLTLNNALTHHYHHKRGSGWGSRRSMIGLRGGGENSLANGTSGWGAPPSSVASGSGWGAPPPPNPAVNAAWGTPNANQLSSSNNDEQPTSVKTVGPTASSAAINSVQASSQPPQPTTSWAAAAGKGLPVSAPDPPGSSAIMGSTNSCGSSSNSSSSSSSTSASKQLEQLNSVREALFSQDGWGGNFVKQDSAWPVDGMDLSDSLKSSSTSLWSNTTVPRNDGTEFWKMNLSGQAPVVKPTPSGAWSHTPQNPTDYKQWGEDEELSGNGAAPGSMKSDTSMWSDANNAHNYGTQKPKDDWGQGVNLGGGAGSGNSGVNAGGWNERAKDSIGGRLGSASDSMNHRAAEVGMSWSPGGGGVRPSNTWGNPPPYQLSNDWNDAPTLTKRSNFDDGTSLWAVKSQAAGMAPSQSGVSNWKEMPTPNNPAITGLRTPSGPRLPSKDPSPWNSRGWNTEPVDASPLGGSTWSDAPDVGSKRDFNAWSTGNGNVDTQWNVGAVVSARPRLPGPLARRSPAWDDGQTVSCSGWGNGNTIKPVGPKKLTQEMLWSSKQFRVLCDMGVRKDEAECALRQTNLNLEDALELLNANGRLRDSASMFPGSNQDLFDRRFDGPSSSGAGPNLYSPDSGQTTLQSSYNKPIGSVPGPSALGMSAATATASRQQQSQQPQQQPQTAPPPSGQPSAQQLRFLVQQIQMAVQAGHLNAQILNQPLAPQTLISLNQLLQQIKALQTLQQQLAMAQSQKVMSGNNSPLLAVNVNITKTKQNIQNLQNQISAQQAAYLKSQQLPSVVASAGQPMMEQDMPDLFRNLSIIGNASSQPAGVADSAGSRLHRWKLPEDSMSFSKAPGASSVRSGAGGMPFAIDDTWATSGASSGWPDASSAKQSSAASNAYATSNESVSNGLDSFGIPEFEPGKPWKGPGMKNPDEDPNLTPGSMAPATLDMISKASVNSASSNHVSSANNENSLGLASSTTWSFGSSNADMKAKADAWSNGGVSSSTLTPMGQDLWGGKSGRTPPGLGASNESWPASSSSWSPQNGDNCMMNGGASAAPSWLLLKNLTPQIDGSTLKTLCMQHGPLKHFHLFLNHSIALVNYATAHEAQKAQKALNNCLLGNTTIHAAFTSENEATGILQQLGGGGVSTSSTTSASSGSQLVVTSTPTRGNTPNSTNLTSVPKSSTLTDSWVGLGVSVTSGAAGSIWGAPGTDLIDTQQQQHSTPQLSFSLPGDLPL